MEVFAMERKGSDLTRGVVLRTESTGLEDGLSDGGRKTNIAKYHAQVFDFSHCAKVDVTH